MAEIIDLNIYPTIETVDVTIQTIIDNVAVTIQPTNNPVNLNITPNLITINVNRVTGGGAVNSVNTQTGDVVLTQDDVLDGTTYKQYSLTEKNKLAGIAAGAEVNVNADWNATSGDAQILNKPSIPAAQVNSDWNASSGVAQILNKPTIPSAQVNSDWNATSGISQILNKPTLATVATSGSYTDLTNKPTIPAAQIQSDWNQSNNASLDFIKNKPSVLTPLGYYGAWQDNFTQTAASANVGYPLIYRTVDLENQVRVVSNGTNLTRITFDNTGIYNMQFSVQIQNNGNSQHDVTIWLRKNGTDIPGSSGFISVPARKSAGAGNEGHGVYGWNYLLSVVAGEYYEFVWSTSNATDVSIQYYAGSNPPPSTASVILTVTQQSGIMAGTGLTAINSLTGAAQTLVTGSSGTDFAISSSGTAHTFNLPTASASNRGLLSSTDWTTFNNKQNASTRRNANNTSNNNINYCGVALGTGVSESSAVWTITRLTIAASGSITTATATNVAWTNRQLAIYT